MSLFLGIDTSNYTTSAALYDDETDKITQSRRLLPVEKGTLGLRQSDALFQHVRQLPEIVDALNIGGRTICAVSASVSPREVTGSYMPCFLAGESQGRTIASTLSVPFYGFSHQQGHLAAGTWSAGRTDLLKNPFLALHISGGTSELLYVEPERDIFTALRIGGSNDLAIGQLVDRCGALLGMEFPAGPELEKLAEGSASNNYFVPKFSGLEFSVSGLENHIKNSHERGESAHDTARFVLNSITHILTKLITSAGDTQEYAGLPLLCAGGVMSNKLIRGELESRCGAIFSRPEFASDNAAGTAYLAYMMHSKTSR